MTTTEPPHRAPRRPVDPHDAGAVRRQAPRPARRRRPHPAAASRILVAGLATAGTFALVAVFGLDARAAQGVAGAADGSAPTPLGSTPPTTVYVPPTTVYVPPTTVASPSVTSPPATTYSPPTTVYSPPTTVYSPPAQPSTGFAGRSAPVTRSSSS